MWSQRVAALILAIAGLVVGGCSTPDPMAVSTDDQAWPARSAVPATSLRLDGAEQQGAPTLANSGKLGQENGVRPAVTPDIGTAVRGPVVVGALHEIESVVMAEIYAHALQAAGFDVIRQFNFTRSTDATDALLSAHIDLYPERPSVAAVSVLGLAASGASGTPPTAEDLYGSVAEAYALFDVMWLTQVETDVGDGHAPLARAEILGYFPEIAVTLDEVSSRISDAELAALVAEVEQQQREPIEVVARYMKAQRDLGP